MAECVVDLLEVVEVEQHDREWTAVEVRTSLSQTRKEQRAVGQSGQCIVQRLVLALGREPCAAVYGDERCDQQWHRRNRPGHRLRHDRSECKQNSVRRHV